MVREVRGPNFDLVTEPLDVERVVRTGEGGMHGRYHVGDSLLVPSVVPMLAAVRSRDRGTSSASPIQRWPTATQTLHEQFQIISVVSVVHRYLHMIASYSNFCIKYCRPNLQQRRPSGRGR
jgi:hypothetical protein